MNMMKRALALVLALTMLLGMAACGKPAQTAAPEQPDQTLNRQDKELVAELIGGEDDASRLTDEELDALVDSLLKDEEVSDSGVVNLSTGSKPKNPSVDVTENSGAYDENGAIKEPFDQVYPELIEKEEVAFSGESILIKLASGTLTDGLKAAGVGALEQIVPMEKAAWYEAKLLEGTDAKEALAAVRELDEVLLAEFNYEIQVAALDDYKHFDKDKDEDFKKNGHNKDQWHFHHCGIPDGYEEMETEGGDPSVIVAVIDSGVDYTHEDLKDNMWVNTKEIPDNNRDDDGNGYVDDYYGVDIVAGKGSGDDTNGHGTHVAGIIAARNNNVGTLGIAYNVKIMSVKAAMHNGTLNQADIAKAVLYAYNMGAEVINMSFGGSASSIAVQDALQTAYTRCVLVASAGNNGAPNQANEKQIPPLPNYPAALTYVLGVMSVDETGRESIFSNWDVEAFNGVEYELYAPGENIMSTLPGNKYGYLSGTSMAAPVVSSFAAILRSEFADRDMYPTKFIYGQLASTSGIQADCLSPDAHGGHNMPQIVDLNAALTKLPKPEVNVQDFAIFDDPKYSAANNGDGVIDAGETVAVGITLRNRWGMSENTLVTLDTLSTAGLSDPYINIKNPTVDFGSVGTYSTKDSGKIYTDELLTGWENPFLVEISKDCPNDYRFTLNVTITCENALDEADTATYTTEGKVSATVRSGVVLPSIIEEDMVLTPDNLYIIPNATVIQEGVTVRVEPGTHIQFWSDDPKDPYASDYIAFLLVKGNFLVEGTKKKPVYIYPSQLMDNYGVEIASTDSGYVSLEYADITNFFYNDTSSTYDHTGVGNRIDLAEHCTFRQNYPGKSFYTRYLSGGKISSTGCTFGDIGKLNAKDCVFYKMGTGNGLDLMGTADRCIFVESAITYEGTVSNSVFLKNNVVYSSGSSNYIYASTMTAQGGGLKNLTADRIKVAYRPETGTTYVRLNYNFPAFVEFIKQEFGGNYVKIEDEAEFNWLKENGVLETAISGTSSVALFGVQKLESGRIGWYDGTPVADFLLNERKTYTSYLRLDNTGVAVDMGNAGTLVEVPGQILPETITFQEYTAAMDTESTYQLVPVSTPVPLSASSFLYESTDEAVVTVSNTGLVTPVGQGTADVWVYSLDRAVKNRVTVTVKDYVALENIAFAQNAVKLAVGELQAVQVALAPANTTRNNVTYISSDPSVVTVENGILTPVGVGTATVTATCEGLTASQEITVYKKTTALTLDKAVLSAALSQETVALPTVIADEGAETELSWRSTDPNVAEIRDGKVQLKQLGTSTLVVTDLRTGLTASALLIVQDTEMSPVKDLQISQNSKRYVLLENGELYHWGYASDVKDPVCVLTDVEMCAVSYGSTCSIMVQHKDGSLVRYDLSASTGAIKKEVPLTTQFAQQKIKKLASSCATSGGTTLYGYYVLTESGYAYAWGDNNNFGQLGLGVTGTVSEPTLINLDSVADLEVYGEVAAFLTEEGELYGVGHLDSLFTAELKLAATDVEEIYKFNDHVNVAFRKLGESVKTRSWSSLFANGAGSSLWGAADMDEVDYVASFDEGTGVKDGKWYALSMLERPVEIPGVTNAKTPYYSYRSHYVVTEDGMLLGYGDNSGNQFTGAVTELTVEWPVPIFMKPLAEETVSLLGSNLQAGVLTENTLALTFNKALLHGQPKLYADGLQVTLQTEITDYNQVKISRNTGFEENVNYELVFDVGSLSAEASVTNSETVSVSFTYTATQTQPEETVPGAPVIYESQLDETIQRVQTAQSIAAAAADWHSRTQFNEYFFGNAILNHTATDTNVEHWLRPLAKTTTAGNYYETALGSNWWGTTNEKTIGLQMVDYTDFITYYRLMYAPYLTEAPENTFPFVTSVKLFNKYGEEVTTVGNEEITFQVKFNRDMDTTIPLLVRFGSALPYGDYEVTGQYVDARTWEGTYTLNTLIENGDQYFTISNGCSATDDLELQIDQGRFGFVIDTTAAQALLMQGTAGDTGIRLSWTQDDFKTLMGYNVYRSTKEDGQYTRLNKTVIPANTMEWFDDTVEPGKIYYYNFTVVQSDMTESEPSGKIVIMSKDTMAPNIYHSPVANAFTGANLVLDATVTDNLSIAYANLYYRIAGTQEWSIIRMNKLNDKYSAIIPAQYITVAGVEYYIEAFDGVSYTYKGTADAPYTVAVQEAIDANSLGDVDGDGVITNLDALLLLYAINDKYNMTAEEFARADLNGDGELWAAEALRILQYVSGTVGSVKM